jgi:hypothetical protein
MRRGMASHPGAVAWLTKRVGLPLLPAEVGRSYDEVDFNDIAVAIEAERSVSPIKTCFQWCSKGGTKVGGSSRRLPPTELGNFKVFSAFAIPTVALMPSARIASNDRDQERPRHPDDTGVFRHPSGTPPRM